MSYHQNQAPDNLHGTALWNRLFHFTGTLGKHALPADQNAVHVGRPTIPSRTKVPSTPPAVTEAFPVTTHTARSTSCRRDLCTRNRLHSSTGHQTDVPEVYQGGADSPNPTMAPVVLNSYGPELAAQAQLSQAQFLERPSFKQEPTSVC